ncbi:cytochrome c peroxidase [uncultured Chitinophaga sp.]|uniref:cytochrome-c peroxidase n=1 Tax=uncultured Chitinophaga sp. TaxID=339340 RepID=UPI0025FCEE7B|nr:cytochrome c peroxidase [uncultured Chitinophaga sp.]
MKHRPILVGALLVVVIYGCSKADDVMSFMGFRKPANFGAPVYKLENNDITQAGFELGRKLFYEPRLSRNNTISCGDCHIQTSAFTHHGHDVSHGIDDRLGSRNSPPIMNMAWSQTFMWDGGVFDLDLQPIVPITNPVEMDETMANVLEKLRAHPQYPALFKKAFGTSEITGPRMMKAMSQFMVMLVSANSRYDSVVRQQGPAFTPDEQAGYVIFKSKCSNCHQEPLFTDNSFRNNGIGVGYNDDQGRYTTTLNPADKYCFKVPSLRNLAYTAPYMHDGRLLTLDAVLDHYTHEMQDMPTLDPLLKQNSTLGIAVTTTERGLLLSFLNTLNDKHFITDKRFSEQAQ